MNSFVKNLPGYRYTQSEKIAEGLSISAAGQSREQSVRLSLPECGHQSMYQHTSSAVGRIVFRHLPVRDAAVEIMTISTNGKAVVANID